MTNEFDNETRSLRGRLLYVIDNCRVAYNKLIEINSQLTQAMDVASPVNPNSLGDLNRMVQGYLIVRISSLFDEDTRSVSFANLFNGNKVFESIKKEKIIIEIRRSRNEWEAHNDKSGEVIFTKSICNSNLGNIIDRMEEMIK
jgi:hypothetical protein